MSEKQKKTKNNSNDKLLFTRETLGVVMVLFATLCMVFLITGDTIMYPVGGIVKGFLLGTFGVFAYAVLLYAIVKGVMLVVDKGIGYSNKFKVLLTLTFITLALLCQTISMRNYVHLTYGQYIGKAYMLALGEGSTATAGGFITSLASYFFAKLLTNVGSYVVLGVLTLVCGYFTVKTYLVERAEKVGSKKFRSSVVKEGKTLDLDELEIQGIKEYPIDVVTTGEVKPEQKLFVAEQDNSAFKPLRKSAKDENVQIKLDYTTGGLTVSNKTGTYTQGYSSEMQSKLDYIKQPAKLDLENGFTSRVSTNRGKSINATTVSDYIPFKPAEVEEKPAQVQTPNQTEIPLFEHTVEDTPESRARNFEREYLQEVEFSPKPEEPIVQEPTFSQPETPVSQPRRVGFDFTEPTENQPSASEQPRSRDLGFEGGFAPKLEEHKMEEDKPTEEIAPSRILRDRRSRGLLFNDEEKSEEKPAYTSRVEADRNIPSSRLGDRAIKQEIEPTPEKVEKPKPPINRKYNRPPLDLLNKYEQPANAPTEDHEGRLAIIKQTLEDFHIPSEPQGYIQGPSITRYELRIPTGTGISVKKVLNYDDDLKMRLACKDGVRIEAPIPGKDLVGVEVANKVKITVGLREVMELAAKKEKPSSSGLTFAIGKDIVGNPITDNLAKGPHYLVAGATGSGKSVCLNTMIISLIMRYSPEELRLILVDPKSVEFSVYEHIPHLLIDEIITHPKKAIAVLTWAYEEMERRFKTFRESGQFVVDIDSYNSVVASDTIPKIPRIVIIIDELADLMQICKSELESRICAIAQKARSAGIHLVLATQRPSVNVITGTIKANLPSRIAFKVTNFEDSRTILAEAGAEKLLGNGDMLYKNAQMPDLGRYQGAFITAQEANAVCNYIRENNQGYFDDQLQEYLDRAVKPAQEETHADDNDGSSTGSEVSAIFLRSLWLAVTMGKISISALQRRFQIGYSKAGGIVDKMERMGYVSGDSGSKARDVLLTREEYVEKYGEPPAEDFS